MPNKKDPISYLEMLEELNDANVDDTDLDAEGDADEADTDAELEALDLDIPDSGDTEDTDGGVEVDEADTYTGTPGDDETPEDYADEPMEEAEDMGKDTEDTEDTEDTDGVDPEVKALRRENARRRVQLQELRDKVDEQAEAQATRMVAELFNDLTGEKVETRDSAPTFEEVRNQLTGYVLTIELQSKKARQHLALEKAASELGANVDRLLDSVSFNNEINNIDVDAVDYDTLVKRAMQNAVQVNPSFKEADNAPRSGVDMTNGADTPLSGDGIAELAKRRRERRNRA